MAITAQTRTQLIGLSVAMLGSAPGTDRLNHWVADVDDGMSVDDLANHIAETEAFQDKYPTFLTNMEFAEAFLGSVMYGVSGDLMTAAVELVSGMLDGGLSRGSLALAVVDALHDIAMQGMDHDAYADLGMSAMAFANKVEVATHYTLDSRMADPSESVLEGVTNEADSVMMAIDAIDNPPAPPVEPETAQRFVLTPTIDDVMGGDTDDTIVAQPVSQVSSVFQDVLNPFDTIDGGGGTDTIHIFGVNPDDELSLGAEDISNVENVVINTVGGIDADLTDWEGVSMVDLRRFGDDNEVTVIVDDGATVSTSRTFGGDVTIVGSMGALNIEAGGNSMVHIGSAGQTESVMVEGGASILIDNGAGRQSQTVTSVSVDGVKLNAGSQSDQPSGTFVPLTNTNGFVVGQNGSTQVGIDITPSSGDDAISPVGLAKDGVTLTNAIAGTPITVTYDWDDDGDARRTDGESPTEALSVTVELKFDVNSGGLAFGKITGISGITAAADGSFVIDSDGANQRTIQSDGLDGTRVPASTAFTSQDIGKEDADPRTVTVGAMPTLTVNSDAIADVTLASTSAIVLVHNNSKNADGSAMPEDLAVTVDGYGSFQPWGAVKSMGKLCIAGDGSAENIMIDVAGASAFNLASNTVKALDISADARLVLDVNKFTAEKPDNGPSETLASVMVSGEGSVSMDTLAGMKKLASIDASMSSGNNSFKSANADGDVEELAALTMAMGGSGNDTFQLGTSLRGRLETIDTGDGNDTVMMSGDYRDDGLMVALGSGNDTFHGNAGNSESRIDGGDGRDTLRLSADGATYKDGDDTVSIYANFEILDLGGGSGIYDVGRLGVDTLVVNKTTSGVELNNVAGGTTLDVSAEKTGVGTSATVEYEFADDVNVGGSLIDGGTSNVLNVSLMARGGKTDTKKTQSGKASLTIELDGDLRAMAIQSDAGVHGDAADIGVTAGHYENTVTVSGTSALEEVKITGNAQTNLSGAGLANLEYVNAAGSGASVTVDASTSTARIRLIGSQQDDTLTAGSFEATATARNTLVGNGGDDSLIAGDGGSILVGGAGEDSLTGGDGVDLFVFNAASESQVSFKRDPADNQIKAEGYDTITDFKGNSEADKVMLSKALWAIVSAGGFKGADEWGATANVTRGWNPADQDGAPGGDTVATTSIDGDPNRAVTGDSPAAADGSAEDLRDFIGNGRGLFLTTVADASTISGTRQVKNSVAVVNDTTDGNQGTWLLFDIDSDGNFDDGTDMVIFLAGAAPVAFVSGDLVSA